MSHVLTAIAAFLFGSFMMLSAWDQSAKRGRFEVGGVMYKVEVINP